MAKSSSTASRKRSAAAVSESLPLQSFQSNAKSPSFAEVIAAYQAADRRLAQRLNAALTVEEILQAFKDEPNGSLHHCGSPTLSIVELHQVAMIVVAYLRAVSGRADVNQVSTLPLTLKRAAWKLLSKAEKAYIKKMIGRGGVN